MEITRLARMRTLLLTVKIRFAPELQPVRETALDRLVERLLYLCDPSDSTTVNDLISTFEAVLQGVHLNPPDLRSSLERLGSEGKVNIAFESDDDDAMILCSLDDESRAKLDSQNKAADNQLRFVVSNLFEDSDHGPDYYIEPFLTLLASVFSKLGDELVSIISGAYNVESETDAINIPSEIKKLLDEYSLADPVILREGIVEFFRRTEPVYNTMKWNMAQNFFVAKSLGLDDAARVLSKNIFDGADLYLDTNIIIEALEPSHRYHKSFLAFVRMCKAFDINLKVCNISIDEMHSFITGQRDTLSKTVDQIPEDIATNIRSMFLRKYYEQVKENPSYQLDTVFDSFADPITDLERKYSVEIIDDAWFDKAAGDKSLEAYTTHLRNRYKNVRGRLKSIGAAKHDAQLLAWISMQRETVKQKTWLITTDRSLPGTSPGKDPSESLAVTLDAILQWISPLSDLTDEEMDFPLVFSEMINNRLLPLDQFFVMEDFLIFHDMGLACKELPAEDVEKCIRFIRSKGFDLNPSKAEDRERVMYEITKFFKDPGLKYKSHVESLEKEIATKDDRIGIIEKDLSSILLEKGELQHQLESTHKANRGIWRFVIVSVLFVIGEIAIVWFAGKYGQESNLIAKWTGFGVFGALIWPALCRYLCISIVGGDNLKYLPKTIQYFLK